MGVPQGVFFPWVYLRGLSPTVVYLRGLAPTGVYLRVFSLFNGEYGPLSLLFLTRFTVGHC